MGFFNGKLEFGDRALGCRSIFGNPINKSVKDLMNKSIKTPIIVGRAYEELTDDQLQLSASADLGSLLIDGLGDEIIKYNYSIWIISQ